MAETTARPSFDSEGSYEAGGAASSMDIRKRELDR